jgi:hypothetical protein
MAYENHDVQNFIVSYDPDTPIMLGVGDPITLEQALLAEQLFCPADMQNRRDPIKRLGYLARKLSDAGSLRPEHQYLIEEAE